MKTLKWIWRYARQAKGLLALAVVLMAVESLSALAAVALQQRMIDDVLLSGAHARFWPTLALIGAAYLVHSLLFTFGPHVIHLTVARLRLALGETLMQRLFRLPTATMQQSRTASYVYHFTHDLQTCAHLGASDLPRLVQQVVTALAVIGIMAAASPMMLLAMLGFTALYALLGRRFAPLRKQAAAAVAERRSALLVQLEEGVASTREVVAYHREAWEAERYAGKFGSYFGQVVREGKLINKQLLLSDPLKWGSLLFVLMYGGMLVMDNQLSVGLFVVAVQFTTRLMESLSGVYQYAMDLSGKLAAADRIRAIVEGARDGEGVQPIDGPIRDIAFRAVEFRYDEQPVLRGLELVVTAGQKIALVGPSGGGKSTVASLLARFFEPDAGTLAVSGVPLERIRREAWSERVTIVFQEPYLFPDSIRMNLLLGRQQPPERVEEVCRAMQIHDVIAALPEGYDTVIGERGVTLSGGQRQRLALVRAVLRDPEVLVLDEATSALDLKTERRVQDSLDRLRAGRTTIVIAHRLSTVRNADRIYVIDGGQAVAHGTHDELLRSSALYRGYVSRQGA
ncbi:ABC transporter ATP-binding protein [Paenibacillus sp. IB182496]|uniref:ABC transporter ATP-binding protein n=1 Tax=Paenibacillus sabuli TaxID=2772509 RepID=A0A927GQ42_9BACL|nr:ABC transporter ATP-binding protein [Paenibacillus sabuli]MBD2843886.1 ABC transporter ATP-binding protein [Paenibacillus sabuli]